ncbi:MAG TPA: metal-dependent phosphohydrolase [Actinomycetes bacterium]
MRHLAPAWLALARRVAARGDVAGAGAYLLRRWTESHRAYHDLAHLDEVLRRVDLLEPEADRPDTVRLAAWFHDVIYDPTAPDNEERSAEVATTVLQGIGLDADLVADVARLVRLTATHDVAADDRDGAVLCDADLAVLAATAVRYESYVEGVRREYAHLDDETFARGRAAVLRSLLDRPVLFRTAFGRQEWEDAARANAGAELARLTQ